MICVIPARGGSQRIPRKNIKLFHGKPIIAYSIELGLATCNQVVVSTDSQKIAAVAKEYGAEVHARPPALARDEIGTQDVVGEVLRDLDANRFTMVCALYATAPLLIAKDVKEARWMHSNTTADCIYSVDVDFLLPTGGFYLGPAKYFWEGYNPYLDRNGIGLITGDIDINTPEDWERAEKLYEERYG